MPPLTDPIRSAAFRDALENWNFADFIQFDLTVESRRWIKQELKGVTLKEIKRLMYEHVAAGGEIDEVAETREEWRDHPFHYDLRLTIDHRRVYVETRLNYREPFAPDESWILVVNIHEA